MRRFFALTLLLLVLSCPTQSQTGKSDITVEKIIKAVEKYPQQIQSARIEGVEAWKHTAEFERLHPLAPGEERSSPRRSVVWAFKGDRQYRKYTDQFDSKAPRFKGIKYKMLAQVETDIFDGKQKYSFHEEVNTHRAFNAVYVHFGPPEKSGKVDLMPLSFGYKVNDRWLADELRAGHYEVTGSSNDPQFGLLHQLTDSSDSHRIRQLWIAPRFGFLMVQYQDDLDGAGSSARFDRQLIKIERRGAFWLPMAGSIRYSTRENGTETLMTERTYQATRFELNSVDDKLFDFELKPGYLVTDVAANNFWKVGAKGNRIYRDLGNSDEQGTPFSWLLAGTLGSVMLLSGGAWWRRRQLSATR